MENKNAILIIDAQYDFTNPEGALFVQGADGDMKRLAQWIKTNQQKIDHITVTIDSHPVNDISHPAFWKDANGKSPEPFTAISLKDIQQGIWMPRYHEKASVDYIEALEKDGEFGHFIWPYHCLSGSRGAAVDDTLMEALMEWSGKGSDYQVVTKGTYPLTEHFGIFRANVPDANHPETLFNESLVEELSHYDNVYLAGEAKSHCVANSLKQAMDLTPQLAQKIIILEDCMSDVVGLEYLGKPIYDRAKEMGIRFAKSSDEVL